MKKIVIKKRNLTPTKNAFQALARSIIYQQLSGKAAGTIYARFVALWKKKFPKPEDVIGISEEQMRGAGLSRGKITYLKDLAAKFIDGTINPKHFPKMSDQEIIDHLTQVKGIGVWTAHMFLIFSLNRPDILPVGDLAIKKGFMKAFGLRKMPTEAKMIALAKDHIGNRTYLSLHLWKLMDEGTGDW